MGLRTRILGGGDDAIARARRPEALRASMAEPPKEGIDWLGRVPGPRAPRLYRLLLTLSDLFLFGLCRLHLDVQGRERLPRDGRLRPGRRAPPQLDRPVAGHPGPPPRAAPVVPGQRPDRVRPALEGAAAAPYGRHPAGLARRYGPRRSTCARHAPTVGSGAVLALFVEGAIGGPPDRLARVRDGAALLALRLDAPIVPVAVCGAESLYRGKRMAARIGAPISVAELLGGPPSAAPGTRDELREARRLTRAMAERIDAMVAEAYPGTVDPPERPRRWTWLDRLMR